MTRPGQVIPWTATKPKMPARPRLLKANSGPMFERDEFTGTSLAPSWMMMRQPRQRWWTLAGGKLTLQPRRVGLSDFANPSFLARRQQHMFASATTKVRPSANGLAEAGLVALQNDEHWFFLAAGRSGNARTIKLRMRGGPNDPREGRIVAEKTLPLGMTDPIHLKIDARAQHYDFSWSGDGRNWTPLHTGADGTILSTKRAGGFVGAVFGLHAYQPNKGETRP